MIGNSMTRWLVCAGATILISIAFACDESLPPREPPRTVLVGDMSVIEAGKTVLERNGVPLGLSGAFQIRITNVYDDVLQDSAILSGHVEFWMKDNPDLRAVIPLSSTDVTTKKMLVGRILTIGVDSTLIMIKQWNHCFADGTPIWEHLDLRPGVTMGGDPYCISDTIPFIVRSSLRVFKTSGQIQFPDQEVKLVYQIFGFPCQLPL